MKINSSFIFKVAIVAGFLLGCSWGEGKKSVEAFAGKDSVYKKDILFSAASYEVPATKISRQLQKNETFFTVLPGAMDSTGQECDSLIVPYGVQYEIRLPIDINIFLNSGSLLIFNPVETRSFQIKGEAIFEIGKHPGSVKVGKNIWINAEVNSRFYVSNYTDFPEEPLLVVGMLNGTAKLQGERDILTKLNTGEHIQIDSTMQVIEVTHVDTTALLRWTQQEFFFDEVDAYQILKNLSRWYNVPLDISRDSLYDYNFRIIKRYDEPLDSFLEALNRAMNYKLFTVKNGTIRLTN